MIEGSGWAVAWSVRPETSGRGVAGVAGERESRAGARRDVHLQAGLAGHRQARKAPSAVSQVKALPKAGSHGVLRPRAGAGHALRRDIPSRLGDPALFWPLAALGHRSWLATDEEIS